MEIDPKASVNKMVVKSVEYGFIRRELRKEDLVEQWHYWTLFFQSAQNQELSHFVKRVAFLIDPSFDKPCRVLTSPPYEITVFGISSFTAFVYVQFTDETIEPQFFEINIEIAANKPYSMKITNDFIVFARPSFWFYNQLKIVEPARKISGILHYLRPDLFKGGATSDEVYKGTETTIGVYRMDEIEEHIEREKIREREDAELVNSVIDEEKRGG